MSLERVLEEIAIAARQANRKPEEILLVVVSKGQTVEAMARLYERGVRDFGESRVQEVEEKRQKLPKDIRWHMIGSIQTKKVPKIVGEYHLLHSVDSLELAKKLSQKSVERQVITDCLLEVNCSHEATKHGFLREELLEQFDLLKALPSIRLMGLMTMAAQKSSEEEVRATFRSLSALRDKYPTLKDLSMGMSQDFQVAITEGATIVRIGTRIFGG